MCLVCIRWRNSELSTGGSNYASLRKIKGAGFTQIGVSTIIVILHAIELQEHILVYICHTLQSWRAAPSCSHILVLVYMYARILMHGTTMPLSSLSLSPDAPVDYIYYIQTQMLTQNLDKSRRISFYNYEKNIQTSQFLVQRYPGMYLMPTVGWYQEMTREIVSMN